MDYDDCVIGFRGSRYYDSGVIWEPFAPIKDEAITLRRLWFAFLKKKFKYRHSFDKLDNKGLKITFNKNESYEGKRIYS